MNQNCFEIMENLAVKSGLPANLLIEYKDHLMLFTQFIVDTCCETMEKESKDAQTKFTYMGDDVPTLVLCSAIKKKFSN